MKFLVVTKKDKKKYGVPIGTTIDFLKDKTVYNYPSGKRFVKHKSLSEIYGKAYDFNSDG